MRRVDHLLQIRLRLPCAASTGRTQGTQSSCSPSIGCMAVLRRSSRFRILRTVLLRSFLQASISYQVTVLAKVAALDLKYHLCPTSHGLLGHMDPVPLRTMPSCCITPLLCSLVLCRRVHKTNCKHPVGLEKSGSGTAPVGNLRRTSLASVPTTRAQSLLLQQVFSSRCLVIPVGTCLQHVISTACGCSIC